MQLDCFMLCQTKNTLWFATTLSCTQRGRGKNFMDFLTVAGQAAAAPSEEQRAYIRMNDTNTDYTLWRPADGQWRDTASFFSPEVELDFDGRVCCKRGREREGLIKSVHSSEIKSDFIHMQLKRWVNRQIRMKHPLHNMKRESLPALFCRQGVICETANSWMLILDLCGYFWEELISCRKQREDNCRHGAICLCCTLYLFRVCVRVILGNKKKKTLMFPALQWGRFPPPEDRWESFSVWIKGLHVLLKTHTHSAQRAGSTYTHSGRALHPVFWPSRVVCAKSWVHNVKPVKLLWKLLENCHCCRAYNVNVSSKFVLELSWTQRAFGIFCWALS